MATTNQNRSTAVATISSSDLAAGTMFNERQINLIREQIADGATDDELMLFVQVASSRGLDPFRKHVYAVMRYDSKKGREVMAIQVSIDGLRLIAQRSGRYEGQTPPMWCGPDGQWTDIWLAEGPPAAAKVGVYIKGTREPLVAVALYRTFVQKGRDGKPTKFWADMPEHMLAKVAEAQALRKAFPEEAAGLYTGDEMGQADNLSRATLIDHETGEVIEASTAPRGVQDPERDKARRALWQLANGTFGWDIETINLVAMDQSRKTTQAMSADELTELYHFLVVMSEDDRAAMLDVLRTPAIPAS